MEEKNRLLIIVDPQVDFTLGTLRVDGGKEAMDRLAHWLKTTNIDFQVLVVTEDCHPTDHCSFIENGGPFPAHCVACTDGAEIYKPVMDAFNLYVNDNDSDFCFLTKGEDKDTEEFSGLSSDDNRETFRDILDSFDIDEVWIAGLATDYCVLETLKDIVSVTEEDGTEIVVMYNCIAAVDKDGEGTKEFNKLVNDSPRIGICEVQELRK